MRHPFLIPVFLLVFLEKNTAQMTIYSVFGSANQIGAPYFFAKKQNLPQLLFLRQPYFVVTKKQDRAPRQYIPEWAAEQLPFFCKIEHNLGKKLPIAFKFRLGSVEYVDWLEGKN